MGRNGLCIGHDGKREANLAKHGLDFFDIASVFDGRPALVRLDRRFDDGEDRFNLLARLEAYIVNVAFTLRGEDYHVISARVASRKVRLVFDEGEKRQFWCVRSNRLEKARGAQRSRDRDFGRSG